MVSTLLARAEQVLSDKAPALAASTELRQALLTYLNRKWCVSSPDAEGSPAALSGRLAEQLLHQWVNEVGEIADAIELLRSPNEWRLGSASHGDPISIECGLSDPHREGRTVHILHCAGKSMVLKPRSVGQEQLVGRVLSLIGRSLWVDLPAADGFSVEGRGFCQYVRHTEQRRPEPSFLFNAGVLVLAVELLGMTDCHPGNLHLTASGPVMIDCETIFHPTFDPMLLAWDQPPDGPLRSELLLTLAPLLLDDRDMKAFKGGYSALWTMLVDDRKFRTALTEEIRSFSGEATRVVYRATRFYHQVLCRLRARAVAGSRIDKDYLRAVLSHGFGGAGDHPARKVIDAEMAALARLDVPRFEMICDERDLRDDGVVIVPQAVGRSGLDDCLRRIASLRHRQLARTLHIIESYLNYLRVDNPYDRHGER